MKNLQKVMLRGKVEGDMALLSEGSSDKESLEDKQVSAPCVKGSTFMSGGGGAHIFWKSRPVPGFSGGSEYSVTPPDTPYPVQGVPPVQSRGTPILTKGTPPSRDLDLDRGYPFP